MGISVQVYERTDKRGTWAYHTAEGWYLATSPEHYCTHRFHIKSTIIKLFIEKIHFNHKKLTQPTITHAGKVMATISNSAKEIKNLANGNGGKEMRHLLQITENAMQIKTYNTTETPITTGLPASSSVPLYTNNNTRQTRFRTPHITQILQLSTPSLPRVDPSTKKNINTKPKNIRLSGTHQR